MTYRGFQPFAFASLRAMCHLLPLFLQPTAYVLSTASRPSCPVRDSVGVLMAGYSATTSRARNHELRTTNPAPTAHGGQPET
jgi:hypothetical protein